MSGYIDRMQAEWQELEEKKIKLIDFMHTDNFSKLESVQQGLLMVQLEYMKGYAETLYRRIESNL